MKIFQGGEFTKNQYIEAELPKKAVVWAACRFKDDAWRKRRGVVDTL